MTTSASLLGVVGLITASASPALADGFKSQTGCGGSTFSTCASVHLSAGGPGSTPFMRTASGQYGGTAQSGWFEANSPYPEVGALLVSDHHGATHEQEDCAGEHCHNVDVVPEPFTIVLVGSGLAGIGLLQRRRRGLTDQS